MQKLQSLSIFFPTYNEELNIEETIHKAISAAKEFSSVFEVIIVNDASSDSTVDIVKKLQSEYETENIRLISHDTNKGYGGALITGFKEAQYEYVFFSDADLQFDFSELSLAIPYIEEHPVVIGYRHNRQDPTIRILFAKGWNILNRILFGLSVKDIDCAFKLMRKSALSDISNTSQGNMISAELLIKLTQKGIAIKEIPVTHLPRVNGDAKGVNIRVVIRAFKEIFEHFNGDLGKTSRKQLYTFATVGVLNTVIDIGSYILLTRISPFLATNYIMVKGFTFLAGTFSGFLLNKFITFQQKIFLWSELMRFYIIMLSSLLINTTVTYVLTAKFGLYDVLSVIVATGISFLFSFTFVKTWVFVMKTNKNTT